ncbi:uncharacterized protein [Mytilus edulis]|uniref:uncharacterized protein isoform X3 n=1 Tax=Mytilus edulis TaxID=6550 RepID=UPI0039F0839B
MKGDIFLVTFVLFLCYFSVDGSGYLKNPASRNSIWRYFGAASFASNIIANHDDMNVNCGGTFVKDHNDLPQKCGICGDPKNGPLDHEDPSKYAKGYITQVYHEGTTINVTVTVTGKKEGGFFMLDLCCPAGNSPVTEQCFQRLIFKDTNSNTLPINNFEGDGSFEVILPPGVTGDRCVMRWIWITANEYSCDPTGLCGVGYWEQPAFVNCADVIVLATGDPIPPDFEYPDYTSTYSSINGCCDNGTSSTSATPVPTDLSSVPIGGSTTPVATTTMSPTTSIGISIVTVDPTGVTGTTDTPPSTQGPIIGPVGPVIASSGLGLPSLGFFAPFLPFGLPVLAKFGFGWWANRQAGGIAPRVNIPPPPGPIVYEPMPLFGGPSYVPAPVPVSKHYKSYGKSESVHGYGNNYNSYNGNYGNNNYGNNRNSYRSSYGSGNYNGKKK